MAGSHRPTVSMDDDLYGFVAEESDERDVSNSEVIRQCIRFARSHGFGSDANGDEDGARGGDAPGESLGTRGGDAASDAVVRRLDILAEALDVDVERELVRREIAAMEMPGRSPDVPGQREAVLAVYDYLRDADGDAAPRDIRDVYESAPANYANATQWWENLKPTFRAVSVIEQVTTDRWRATSQTPEMP